MTETVIQMHDWRMARDLRKTLGELMGEDAFLNDLQAREIIREAYRIEHICSCEARVRHGDGVCAYCPDNPDGAA